MDKKYPYQEAISVATSVVNLLKPGCFKIDIAGSLRREKNFVHDIDIVLQPLMSAVHGQLTLFEEESVIQMPIALNCILDTSFQTACINFNKYYRTLQIIYRGIPVDLFLTEPDGENYGALLQMRTGSAEFNMRLAAKAKSLGAHYNAGHGIFMGDQRLDDGTEAGIFATLGYKYVEPKLRG
jgi:DNA polymerase/3'-5' exonuclease PolX